MTDIKRALSLATNQLQPFSDTARLDAEILLAHALEKPRIYLYAHSEILLTSEQLAYFQTMVAQRSLGKPVAYIIGTREFWSLPLKVCEETLIPRPETELLVEMTLELLETHKHACVLDLGTGSGAIALALAKEHPNWQIIACDCSLSALKTAQTNAHRLNLTNLTFHHSDWFTNIASSLSFDAIVSNPPYIAANDPHLTMGDVRFEPLLALVSGHSGFSALEHIIQSSYERLKPQGILLLEHGYEQKEAVLKCLADNHYQQLQSWQDLQGHYRVSGGRRMC
ncbi:MAG: protein-(glutamine-N5) methyltransferase, release factor-specific [Legionellaceae bacterium]|nr:protein-(glutamine-N5) methyltransferase, release factor-specific [Legionellaceae bacterium]|tara:strand:+ start:5448 stop:6293 length:846 start_codon:yes stop_codon:yes gene_type:complete